MIRVIKLFAAGLILFLCAKIVAGTAQSVLGLTLQTTAYLTGVLNGTLITTMIHRLPEE